MQEKEILIASLKRQLKESQELLAASDKSTAEMTLTSGSQSLSPQTQQQIAHLRSELQRARSALTAMQDRSGSDSEGGEVVDDVGKMEAELRLLRSSASMSARDFVKVRKSESERLAKGRYTVAVGGHALFGWLVGCCLSVFCFWFAVCV